MGDAPPLVEGSALLGSARDLQRDQLGTYRKALEQFGGGLVRFRLGPPRVGIEFVTAFRPDDARQVLATDAASYDKQVPAFDEFRWVIGNGLITSEGDVWRRDRRIVAPLFTRRRISTYVQTMARAAGEVVAKWEAEVRAGGQVDVNEMGRRYALDVLGRTVFGDDVESLAADLEETISLLSEFSTRRALAPVRLPASIPTPRNRRADHARHLMWEWVEGLIAARRAGDLSGEDLLSLLLAARDPDTDAALDDESVRDQALTFLVAGHETTGATLAFALHLLGLYPEEQQRVSAEVASVAGERPIESNDLERLTYTAAVIQETMRLYPPGHTIVRRATQPVSLGGYELPIDQIVAVSVWGIHHNPEVWNDPHRFDPTRFLTSDDATETDTESTDRYSHLPFGGGPRSCIGHYLATAELTVALATLVRAFKIETADQEPALDVGATLRPRGALRCSVSPRFQ